MQLIKTITTATIATVEASARTVIISARAVEAAAQYVEATITKELISEHKDILTYDPTTDTFKRDAAKIAALLAQS